MRRLARQPAMRARFLLLLYSTLAVLGCAPPPQGPLPGASDAWRENTPPTKTPAPPPRTWARFDEVRSWPPLDAQPFQTQGHQPTLDVDVAVSETARATYTSLVTDSVLPDGALLAELAHDLRQPTSRAWLMTKQKGEWSYLELDGQGHVLDEGRLARCEGCHALAPADHVFGLPRTPAGPRN